MSLPYFYAPRPADGVLDGAEAKHAHVKRIAPGEHIMLVDGAGHAAEIAVRECSRERVAGDVVAEHTVQRPTPRVTVVQAVPKSERAELAVDLAVQGGADAIIPWISHRTIARWSADKQAKQVQKWRNQAAASAKQARRAWLPEVHDAVTTNQLKDLIAGKRAIVLHEDATDSIKDVDFSAPATAATADATDAATAPDAELFVLVGPEGGIGQDEVDLLGAHPVRMGPQVLRTASAGFAALCAIGALTSRW